MSSIRLTVVIVNYNVRHFLEQCLLSVERAAEGLPVEVIVVDNNSRDDSVAMVEGRFPKVKIIANTDNPGFSRANNQAIRASTGEYIILLNPDTVVGEETFRICMNYFDAHPRVGGLGVRMIDGSGTFLPESKRGFPSPFVAFAKTVGLSRLFPKSRLWNVYHLGFLDEHQNHSVDVLAGAFMGLRRSVLDEIGLLDESFFMYGEDIDLSYRIVQAGYANHYVSETTIIHYKGESTKKGSLNYVRVFYQAMIIFAQKHFTGQKARLFVRMLQTGIYLRAVLTVLSNIFRAGLLPILDTLLIIGGLYFLKDFWGGYHFGNPDYYGRTFMLFNAPLYTLFWMGSIYLSGGYDRTATSWRLIRGILVGTLVIAAVYGFLDQTLRSSRALIILGMLWAIVGTNLLRMLRELWRSGSFRFGLPDRQNLGVVGRLTEAQRAVQLLQQAEVEKNVVGYIHPDPGKMPDQEFLGGVSQLPNLIKWYNLNELIFCMQDMANTDIINWMDRLGKKLAFKILPEGSSSIIGSSSKNTAGELYTIDIRYQIATPENRRNKRLVDLGSALVLIILAPIWMLVSAKRTVGLFRNIGPVLIGRKTWIGYGGGNPCSRLPRLRGGAIGVGAHLRATTMDEATQIRLNRIYAKEYKPVNDVVILWKYLRG